MIKKVFIIFVIIILLVSYKTYAFYAYEIGFTAFKLNRNIVPVQYKIYYDKTETTNQNVEIVIEFDKTVTIIGDKNGFILSDDGKKCTKNLTSNESGSFKVRDEDFNFQTVDYNVYWIIV